MCEIWTKALINRAVPYYTYIHVFVFKVQTTWSGVLIAVGIYVVGKHMTMFGPSMPDYFHCVNLWGSRKDVILLKMYRNAAVRYYIKLLMIIIIVAFKLLTLIITRIQSELNDFFKIVSDLMDDIFMSKLTLYFFMTYQVSFLTSSLI